ncbi:glycoside hydrolase family 127 protein [Arachidicoccus terrestris]|uniref:glycoside hydrolase family 127 protein n=1 Tax=Arachidicoccus terrestris TaxID=2875539 RepID=UPI001CC55CC3|nr:glycoside hydrolase family 127 protein [Arachidicoccus terrestris]UAY57033.1 glycoside hydrolase family 127 protein [Arachidicoccus terrestris]
MMIIKNRWSWVLGIFIGLGSSVSAQSQMVAEKMPAHQALERFALEDVRLLNGPFYEAQQIDLDYILKLEPDRLLAPYLREAGLSPKAKSYGNWESMGLDGHTAGHYLTALAQMYAATGSKECQDRLTYMIGELARCQQASAIGYVGGVPGGKQMWSELRKGNFDLFGKKWVPWYNLHKLFSGLRDAYLIAHNQQAKTVLIKLADWAYNLLNAMSAEQISKMLRTEYGGMNAVSADIYEITGDLKYLKLAKLFSQPEFVQDLASHKDNLTGLHANTQIPKVIGFEKVAQADPASVQFGRAASFFWNTVVYHRSLATGGNSVHEHFNPINDFSGLMESVEGPETCNSYNMLKLTELLFLSHPKGGYMDYYERTLYNQMLATQRGGKGGFVYFTSLRPRDYRVYSSPQKDFWCCVGTGMENHGKYGEMIYSHNEYDLFVNLFISSSLRWKGKGIRVTQTTKFPFNEKTSLKLSLAKPGRFSVYLRKPQWVQSGFAVKVNGESAEIATDLENKVPGYIALNRNWKDGDEIELTLPMNTRLVALPDKSDWSCFMHGPVVLAAVTDTSNMSGLEGDGGRFDHIAGGPLYELSKAPLLVVDSNSLHDRVNSMVKAIDKSTMTFDAAPLIAQPKYKHLKLIPFFKLNNARYMIYWPVAQPGQVAKRIAQLESEDAKSLPLEKRTVDQVTPGEQQPEKDHLMQSENAETGLFKERHWRTPGSGFFSYQLKMDPTVRFLRITFYGTNQAIKAMISINGTNLEAAKPIREKKDDLYWVDYPISEALRLKPAVEVKFKGTDDNHPVRIFDVRLIK